MKRLLFVLAILAGPSVLSQNVNIPDPNFKNALISLGVDTSGDGEIQVSEAENFTDPMTINNLNINDLTGISAFTNITFIQCGGNNLTQLDVSANSSLERLSCGSNDLTSLILGGNSNLRRIDLFANPISNLDISQLLNLEHLAAMVTDFSTLDVSGNPNLEYLDLSNSLVTSVDVSSNPDLKFLNCIETDISTIDVSNNPLLELLFVSNSNVSAIDVSANSALKLIAVRGLGLNTLDLSNNTALEYIDIRDNQFSDFDFSIFPDLVGLRVRNNQITELDLSANTSLCHFLADSDALEFINVKNGSNPLFFAAPGSCTVEFSVGTGIFSFNPAFSASLSDNLEFICVDDIVYAQQYFTEVPPGVVFTENCALSAESNTQTTTQLYPNPATERVSIASNTQIVSLVIRNTIGQQMFARTIGSNETSIDVSDLSSGIYYVEVISEEGKGIHRLLKE